MKREDRFSTPFFGLVQNTNQVHFSHLLQHGDYVRASRHCESSRARRSARRKPGVCALCMVPDLRSPRNLARPLRNRDESLTTRSRKYYVFRRRKNRIVPLRCDSPNVSLSPEVVHRPTSQFPLHFDIRPGNIQHIHTEN